MTNTFSLDPRPFHGTSTALPFPIFYHLKEKRSTLEYRTRHACAHRSQRYVHGFRPIRPLLRHKAPVPRVLGVLTYEKNRLPKVMYNCVAWEWKTRQRVAN